MARKYSPDKAQPLYRAAATGGDADAQLWQATMNFDGLDNGNFSAATRWAGKISLQRQLIGEFLLADFAEYGTGMKADRIDERNTWKRPLIWAILTLNHGWAHAMTGMSRKAESRTSPQMVNSSRAGRQYLGAKSAR